MSGVSVDTNIFSALWGGEPTAPEVTRRLNELSGEQRLVMCGAVYGELVGRYGPTLVQDSLGPVVLMPDMPLAAWQRAGEAHAAYARRRRQSGGGVPRRILTDFLIGAHASAHGLSLFTLNTADYADFPEVPLLTL